MSPPARTEQSNCLEFAYEHGFEHPFCEVGDFGGRSRHCPAANRLVVDTTERGPPADATFYKSNAANASPDSTRPRWDRPACRTGRR